MQQAGYPSSRVSLGVDIVEDQRLICELLETGLGQTAGLHMRLTFSNAEDALDRWNSDPPEAVILDITLPGMNGVNAGVRLKRMFPNVAIVLLSSHVFPNVLSRLPRDVAHGWAYLLKGEVTMDILQDAIQQALGDVVIDGAASAVLATDDVDLTQLTTQQRRVLQLLAAGKSNEAIARDLGITRKSVENYVNRIFATLQLGESDAEANRRVIAALAATKLLDIES